MAQVALASAIGAVTAVGSYLLFSNQPQKQKVEGRRLGSSTLTTSTEGDGITKLFGRQRLDGQIIWATEFKETVSTNTTTTQTGGKGGGGRSTTETTNYIYSISLAIAFCEGNSKATLSRMWADGKEIDLSSLNYRFYSGSQTQNADTKIQEVQGINNTPAYRGIAYIVLEDFELTNFGNRVPQITAEIVVPLETNNPVDIQNSGEAFCLIPASGETVYSPSQVDLRTGGIENNFTTRPDNVHNAFREPDVRRSITDLDRVQSNLNAVLVAVSWFGNDLRAGNCNIRPKIESSNRKLMPAWFVGGYNRINTTEVSQDAENRPVFGGTPSDQSVTELIQYLNGLGKRVVFYPFILMDLPQSGSTLPNPYSDNAASIGQPAFPWRGRITCSPADGFAGSVNNTEEAATQVNNFFNEYDAMIRHYVDLCNSAGGVDAFIIGTELPGITKIRSSQGVYPAISRLQSLAAYAKANLGQAKIGYAADWSEWVDDATDGLWFHLDPLWADDNIDFCGVDNYLPLSDWRDGAEHLDYDGINGPVSEYDPNYLASQIEGGEYFDYYYANVTDRKSQTRTLITDGAHNKPWVYRRKDFRNWWLNQHINRPAHIESGGPTAWVPGSKPIWFTEFGFPAVDKGTNQPNVFYDPKSSESAFPYFSTGQRDDFIQRVGIETVLDYWKANSPENNGLKMIEPANMFIWNWDARPFPDYPVRTNVWSDGDLWFYGHWLTGRIDSVPLPRLVDHLCQLAGLSDNQYDTTGLYGEGSLVRGFQIAQPETIRASLETLMQAYLFDAFESEGKIKFLLRANTKTSSINDENIVISSNDPVGVTLTRAQETDLPTRAKVTFIDEFNNYNTATVDGKTSRGSSRNIEQIDLSITLNADYARSLADGIIQAKWIERQGGILALPPSMLRLDPGDAITFPVGSNNITGRLIVLNIGEQRNSEFRIFNPGIFSLPAAPTEETLPATTNIFGSSTLLFLDLPLFTGREPFPHAPRIAAYANPWSGGVNLYRRLVDETFQFNLTHEYRNAIGQLNTPLRASPAGLWDRANTIDVTFEYGALSSVTEASVLESAIALGIYNSDLDEWELVQFATATLTGERTYNVTDLLRGQLGTEHAIRSVYPAGTRVVLIEPAFLSPVIITEELVNEANTFSWGPSRYPQVDSSYQNGEFTGKRVGLRPYSVACLKMATNPDNDLLLAWKRRTRFGGDSWASIEVPLNEESEQYRVRIYNNDTIVHEAIVTTPTYTYISAQQVLDFGSIQTTLRVDIAQYGAHYGGYGIANIENLEISAASTNRRNTGISFQG